MERLREQERIRSGKELQVRASFFSMMQLKPSPQPWLMRVLRDTVPAQQ